MKETEINRLLKAGRTLADRYYSEGKIHQAQEILGLTSRIALTLLEDVEIRSKVICHSCGRQLKLGKEIQFYANIGSCYNCEDAHAQEMEEYARDTRII